MSGPDFILILYRQKWIVLAFLIFGIALAVIAINITTPKYEVTVVTVPSPQSSTVENPATRALSALGISDRANGNQRKFIVIALLQSREFLQNFVHEHDLLPVLFPDRWDAATGTWRPDTRPPTLEDGYKKLKGMTRIEDDSSHGVIRFFLKWTDAKTAADWANGLVKKANDLLQQQAVDRANLTREFLAQEYGRVAIQDVRANIADLMVQQIEAGVMAKAQSDYALTVIDPAEPTRSLADPRPLLYMAVGILLGLLMGVPTAFFVESLPAARARVPAFAPENGRARAL